MPEEEIMAVVQKGLQNGKNDRVVMLEERSDEASGGWGNTVSNFLHFSQSSNPKYRFATPIITCGECRQDLIWWKFFRGHQGIFSCKKFLVILCPQCKYEARTSTEKKRTLSKPNDQRPFFLLQA